MALINCPECGKQVSSEAPTCPSCAYPFAQKRKLGQLADDFPVVTEATGKKWKFLQIVGVLMIIGGCVAATSDKGGGMQSTEIMVLGGLLFIGARVGAWWYHG